MRYLVDYMMQRSRRFTVGDWAVIKAYLLTVGILIGSGCANCFKKLRPLLWAGALCGMVYTVYRIFYCED